MDSSPEPTGVSAENLQWWVGPLVLVSQESVLLQQRAAAEKRVQHPMLVARFLEHLRTVQDPRFEEGIQHVESALEPLRVLGQTDPDARREAEWILALAALEGAMLELLWQIDAAPAVPRRN